MNSAREDSVKVRRGDKRVLHHNENEIRWTARSEKEQWERSQLIEVKKDVSFFPPPTLPSKDHLPGDLAISI